MKRTLLILAVTLTLIPALMKDMRQWQLSEAYRRFRDGDLKGAITGWSSARGWDKGNAADYNIGVARFRMGDYSGAIGNFRAAAGSTNRVRQHEALYNLGTSYLAAALKSEGCDKEEAVRLLTSAERCYRDARSLNPADADTVHNQTIVTAKLAALKPRTSDADSLRQKPESREQERTEPDKSKKPVSPSQAAGKAGEATEMDGNGVRRRSTAMTPDQALRMLDDARGRESLRSAVVPTRQSTRLSAPEKDW